MRTKIGIAIIVFVLVSGLSFADAEPPLQVLSWSFEKEHSYIYTRGEVKNVSNQPIDRLIAVVILRTHDGAFVKSDWNFVEFRPLMPGQTSPFEVISSDNPLITKVDIVFKIFGGSTINASFKKQDIPLQGPPPGVREAREQARAELMGRDSRHNDYSMVKEVQTLLIHLGYDAGPIDGVNGPRTREALKSFRRDHDREH